MNVVIRDKAFADLSHIFQWIAKDQPTAAAGVIERIFESLDRLAVFPFMGHRGLVAGTYEWVVPGLSFIIVYQIDEPAEELKVQAVFHSREDRDYDIE